MPGKLTAIEVAKQTKPGRYADGGGLYLQVSQWGTKSWVLRFMRDGVARTMGLGDIDTFSLKEARERARLARQKIADGLDPIEDRKAARQAARIEAAKTITFEEAATRYIKAHSAGWKNLKHADQWAATLATYAYPVIGDLPAAAIDTGLVLKVLEPIWTTKTETASRVRGRMESILSWATVSGYRSGPNPAQWKNHLDRLLPAKTKVTKVRHQPALPWQEMPTFMGELRGNGVISARALEFIVLTACRTNEAIGARWDEIDFDALLWNIPGERTKTGRPHRVTLSPRAMDILNGLPRASGGYIFPGARKGQPLSNMAALELLRGMRPGNTVHGFRASFRTWAAEATAFPREVVESALAHVLESKVEAAYQRGELLEKRRKLMEAWAGFCGKPAGNGEVVSLRKGA